MGRHQLKVQVHAQMTSSSCLAGHALLLGGQWLLGASQLLGEVPWFRVLVTQLLGLVLLDVLYWRQKLAKLTLQLGKSPLILLVLLLKQQVVVVEEVLLVLVQMSRRFLKKVDKLGKVNPPLFIRVQLRQDVFNLVSISSKSETDEKLLYLRGTEEPVLGGVELFKAVLEPPDALLVIQSQAFHTSFEPPSLLNALWLEQEAVGISFGALHLGYYVSDALFHLPMLLKLTLIHLRVTLIDLFKTLVIKLILLCMSLLLQLSFIQSGERRVCLKESKLLYGGSKLDLGLRHGSTFIGQVPVSLLDSRARAYHETQSSFLLTLRGSLDVLYALSKPTLLEEAWFA